ncbi:MAG: 50S ribosomal protein L9 [Candidatus Doudnabacteria bacterium]|nr:50S ribosomal protein L9 [Candidatus Doudnabacteria bacterium]
MKIVFTKDSLGHGKKGEVKEVSEGFAKNFLISKGVAQIATPQIISKIEKEKREAKNKSDKEFARLTALKADMEKRTFVIPVKVGERGQVYGGVHEKEIAKIISGKLNVEIDRNKIQIVSAIKSLGEHGVKVDLGSGVQATIKVVVQAL